MATATKQFTITLTLSILEAQTLCTVMRAVGGHPETSARKHTDAINYALTKEGIHLLEDGEGEPLGPKAIGSINLPDMPEHVKE